MGGMGNETRIIALLVIDTVFFFIELITGYAVGSLALVADSFHMLNDVISLLVALYALRLANDKERNKHPHYSYGWQRAEILGALFNGVFLLALCFSIFMEALERLLNKPRVTNPSLVMVVGSLGLLSNIVGLFLFHGHSHGHSHGHDHSHDHSHDSHDEEAQVDKHARIGHPASARAHVVKTAQDMRNEPEERRRLIDASKNYGSMQHGQDHDNDHNHDHLDATGNSRMARRLSVSHEETHRDVQLHRQLTDTINDHGNMNMHGVFLHVLGDAIGNIGVICTGAFILFTHFTWRAYADPIISFVIAVIIFNSALPLVKSASFILLQGVPTSVSLPGVRDALMRVDGVLGVHHLHVWQLNENTNVASVHIMVDCSQENTTRYMHIADELRHALHIWDIHSSTIQPEFVPGGMREAARLHGLTVDTQRDDQGRLLTPDGTLVSDEIAQNPTCLLSCDMSECGHSSCCGVHAPSTNPSHEGHD
ncbi:hypothetical protein MCUN1_001226 [Malassezia cuniculi]|uniref:Cation efflux protein n=1 Tax=Malassezia cuniculi TaxID=948313 RepID=A0AAF0EX83_9BASI|nr:hypothetical protein MCUN1_001226 [Malassezia cuniculi]